MEERTFKTLELDELIALLARHVQTPLGRSRVQQLNPSRNLDEINAALDLTSECADYLKTGGFGLSGVDEPRETIRQLQIEGASLEPQQVLSLEKLIAAGRDLRAQFAEPEVRARFPRLAALCSRLPDFKNLLASVRGKVLPTGEIDDNASPELRRIRRDISRSRERIYNSLESLMRSQSPAIQDEIVTIRNGRFVIPVRTDSRGAVPGVMHGLSSSGQTSYVEPLNVIDQNNDLVRMRDEEEIEIAQILFSIAEAFRAYLPGILTAVVVVAEVDFAAAKARLSAEFQCVRPRMGRAATLRVTDARHPLLQAMLRTTNEQVVPVSLELDPAHQVMVISGANAGGKTVVLKTVGLMALMAQIGLHVPAAEASLPVFDQVFADIGDHQSITANLSTFTSHMRNISEMADRVTPPALVLIDEVGTGTDPEEGSALAVAIVDFFRRRGATTIATTHYGGLKIWASETEGVLNASVEFDEATLRPTYRLITGVAGASSGLEIARRMKLPSEITEQARTLLDPAHIESSAYLKRLKSLADEQEALSAALEEERQATADKYAALDLEFAKREASRQASFESELARVIDEFTAESNRIAGDLRDRAAEMRFKKEAEARRSDLRRAAGARLLKHSDGDAGRSASARGSQQIVQRTTTAPGAMASEQAAGSLVQEAVDIHERDRVLIRTLDQQGVVESISGDTFTVVVGSLRFRARRDELTLVEAAKSPEHKGLASLGPGVSAKVDIDRDFSPELNVIGATVDEATDRVDKFLDEAYLAGAESVRVVHGFGKGALRRAIGELLDGHPHVRKFHPAPGNQGGNGATIIELRK